MTKKRKFKIKMRNAIIIITAILIGNCVISGYGQWVLAKMDNDINSQKVEHNIKEQKKPLSVEINETKKETIREITAYNAGDPAQTDDNPCVGAYGDNICNLLEQGKNVFASNAYQKGTKLQIIAPNGWEMQGVVLDRMNSRYTNRIDIAMAKNEKERAVKFGVQNLIVRELK